MDWSQYQSNPYANAFSTQNVINPGATIYGSSQTDPNYMNYQPAASYPTGSVNAYGASVGQAPAPVQQQSISYGASAAGITNPNDAAGYDAANQADIQRSIDNQQNQIRSGISGGWDSYLGSLSDVLNGGLQGQQTAQTGIALSSRDQGIANLDAQKTSGIRDIGANVRNAMQAGNVYLGAMGAGDSSAANQYSFAVQKNSQQQIGKLNELYTNGVNQLKSTYDQQVASISQWFGEKQNELKIAIGQGQVSKAKDIAALNQQILDQATQQLQTFKTEASNKYGMLQQWAMNNSKNIGELQGNLAKIPQPINSPMMQGQSNGSVVPVGAGASTQGQQITGYDMRGNPIYG